MDGKLRAEQYRGESNLKIPVLLYRHLSQQLLRSCVSFGTSTASNDLQQSWAYEYSIAVLHMSFLRLTTCSPCVQPRFFFISDSSSGRSLVGEGVDNYRLIAEVSFKKTDTVHNSATELRLIKLTLEFNYILTKVL